MDRWVELGVLALAGLLAGYINSIAGAGSLLTLPALIFTGLDAVAANATNRVAVLFQNLAAIVAFRRAGLGKASWSALWLSLPAVVTSAFGAWLSTLLTDAQLKVCIAVAMVVFLLLALIPRRNPPEDGAAEGAGRVRWPMAIGFAAIGLYAGFLQAGVGVLILLYMSLVHRVGLVTSNAMKVVLILVLTLSAIVVFVVRGAGIDPLRGLVLASSTTAGGYVGARAAIKGGERFVRVVLTLVVLASVAKLAWDGLHG